MIDCSQPRPLGPNGELTFETTYWDAQCGPVGGTQGNAQTSEPTQPSEPSDPLADICAGPRPTGPNGEYTFGTQTWDRYCAPMQEPVVDDTLPAGQEAMAAGGYGGAGMSGVFSSTPMGLNYAAPQVPQAVAPPPKVDFVKMLNSVLMADVLGGMLTGRKL